MFTTRIISRSLWRKAVALCVAMAGFVLMYEAKMFDSQATAWMFGGEQANPSPGTRLQFAATAYCKGTTTASGVKVRTGVAAADPTLLPVGSVVNISTGDAKYNGVYTVMDTGPAVKGRELDLYIWSCHEALRFGRKPVQVTVLRLGWDPTASSPTLVDRLFRRREATRRVPAAEPPPPGGMPPGIDETPASSEPDTVPIDQQGPVEDSPVVATSGL